MSYQIEYDVRYMDVCSLTILAASQLISVPPIQCQQCYAEPTGKEQSPQTKKTRAKKKKKEKEFDEEEKN